MRLVKSDLRGLNSLGIYLKATFVSRSMTGDPHFPTPTPTLAELDAAILDLRVALTNAVNGGKVVNMLKEIAARRLADLLKGMAGYVTAAAHGDASIAMSAGFELRDRSKRIGELDMPKRVIARSDRLPGKVKLSWAPVHGARVYQVFAYTEGQGASEIDWRLVKVSSGSRCVVQGLDSCHYHMFRVQAIGVAGAGPMSQPGRALVA